MLPHVITTGTSRNPLGSAAPRDMLVATGAGRAGVYRDGVKVLDGDRPPRRYRDRDGWMSLRHAERYAARRPGRFTWEVRIEEPLWSAAWRRVRSGRWLVVEAGRGFAGS